MHESPNKEEEKKLVTCVLITELISPFHLQPIQSKSSENLAISFFFSAAGGPVNMVATTTFEPFDIPTSFFSELPSHSKSYSKHL